MPHDMARSQDYWDRYARHDPMWAVLSDPNRKGRWDLRVFMETGAREISLLLYELRTLGITFDPASALDFGCGLGRLTQPLADTFQRVIGVDISPEMVHLADKLNRHPDRVQDVTNATPDLRQFVSDTFTFVHSHIVLQHIDPPITLSYVREFFRIAAPGGVVMFHLPSHLRPIDAQTPVRGAMPADAYRASILIESAGRAGRPPSSEFVVQVSLTNASVHEWSQPRYGSIRLGNHWRSGAGDMLVQDDGRATLAQSIGPGETVVAALTVKTPADPGTYVLEVDAVHEGVSWFADLGSCTASVDVTVGEDVTDGGSTVSAARRDAGNSAASTSALLDMVLPQATSRPEGEADPGDPGPFPIHGVPMDTVVELIREAGGDLLHVAADEQLPEWVSYRYFARKRA